MDLPCASPKADRETAQHRSDLDRVDSVAKTADTTSRPAPPFTNPILGWVPGVGHFRRARVGHFWRAPRIECPKPKVWNNSRQNHRETVMQDARKHRE